MVIFVGRSVDGHGHRQRRKRIRDLPDVRNSQTRVDQQCASRAQKQIAVGLFPMAVFADGKGVAINSFNGKPLVHLCAFLSLLLFRTEGKREGCHPSAVMMRRFSVCGREKKEGAPVRAPTHM